MPSDKPRFQLYADECFPLPTVAHLRSKGISITHAFYKNYLSRSDMFHLKISKKLSRVFITLDRDFKYNWTTLKDHPGVILVSSGSSAYLEVNKVCDKAFKKLTSNYLSGSLVTISFDKIVRNKNSQIDDLEL